MRRMAKVKDFELMESGAQKATLDSACDKYITLAIIGHGHFEAWLDETPAAIHAFVLTCFSTASASEQFMMEYCCLAAAGLSTMFPLSGTPKVIVEFKQLGVPPCSLLVTACCRTAWSLRVTQSAKMDVLDGSPVSYTTPFVAAKQDMACTPFAVAAGVEAGKDVSSMKASSGASCADPRVSNR